jgi:hypothetical protein
LAEAHQWRAPSELLTQQRRCGGVLRKSLECDAIIARARAHAFTNEESALTFDVFTLKSLIQPSASQIRLDFLTKSSHQLPNQHNFHFYKSILNLI